MTWFSGQTWLWYLLAFVVGVLVAWLLLVLPAQRRLRALGDTPTDRAATPAAPTPADADPGDASPTRAVPAGAGDTGVAAAAGPQHVLPDGRREAEDGPRADVPEHPEPEPWNARTQQLPAVDSALAVLDSGTGSFRLGLGQATSALFPDPPRPTGRVRPAKPRRPDPGGAGAAPDDAPGRAGAAPPVDAPGAASNDTPTPRTGVPVVPPADGDGPSLFDDRAPRRPGRARDRD